MGEFGEKANGPESEAPDLSAVGSSHGGRRVDVIGIVYVREGREASAEGSCCPTAGALIHWTDIPSCRCRRRTGSRAACMRDQCTVGCAVRLCCAFGRGRRLWPGCMASIALHRPVGDLGTLPRAHCCRCGRRSYVARESSHPEVSWRAQAVARKYVLERVGGTAERVGHTAARRGAARPLFASRLFLWRFQFRMGAGLCRHPLLVGQCRPSPRVPSQRPGVMEGTAVMADGLDPRRGKDGPGTAPQSELSSAQRGCSFS